jgi:DNA mismatch endonuclease (patch repair protein)
MPKTRPEYWKPKIAGNRMRDKRNQNQLQKVGWGSLTVWECELDKFDKLIARIERFLQR